MLSRLGAGIGTRGPGETALEAEQKAKREAEPPRKTGLKAAVKKLATKLKRR